MPDFADVFAELRAIMEPYAPTLERAVDRDDELSLNTAHVMPNGTPLWFGGVQVKKRYVSYHLMPIYVNPALLDDVSGPRPGVSVKARWSCAARGFRYA
jgi:hypothetical protein